MVKRSGSASWKRAHVEGRRWKAVDARAAVEAFRQSGQGLGEFARQHGIKPQRLRCWEQRLDRRESDGDPLEQRETSSRAIELAPVTVRGVFCDCAASISVGGIRVDVNDPQAVPSEWLAEVVAEQLGVDPSSLGDYGDRSQTGVEAHPGKM